MTRTERQALVNANIIRCKGRCYIKAFGGAGKSRIATNFIQYCLKREPNISTVIIVPSIHLKTQWEEILKPLGITAQVLVLNGIVIKKIPIICDICIVDKFCPL